MNARALKTRLRQKLQSRKFERDRLEQMFCRQINTSECKLHNHTEPSVKRRDQGIQGLAQDFNKLQARMATAIKRRKAPSYAVVPHPIPLDKLFDVDVDDAIWDDVGLSDTNSPVEVPPWLSDDQVRTGIRGILLRDRCDEELARLKWKLSVLGEWFGEEWDTVVLAMSTTQEPAEWAAIKQEEMDEDGYQEFEDDDLDVGLVEHMDTLALTEGQNHDSF
ncbi:hypothetical protein BDP27DRAFT_1372621 [Rhodocollybia butyracea]|uniref:Uncharacterized protein n=1 Tax=Rhodocollybia butyracea TaxID=206335 RepID=A0A9P5TWI5_9AGAR|nr:hypothetical protein BDP27DRAFT_1372621 [Rhodocollybia butyracea]